MSPLFVALVTLVIATATPSTSEETLAENVNLLINGQIWPDEVGLESRDVANNPSNQEVSEAVDDTKLMTVRSYKMYKSHLPHNDYYRGKPGRKQPKYHKYHKYHKGRSATAPTRQGTEQGDSPDPVKNDVSTTDAREPDSTTDAREPDSTTDAREPVESPISESPQSTEVKGLVKYEKGYEKSPFGNYDPRNQCFERSPRNFFLRVSSKCQSQRIRRCIDYALRKNPAVAEAIKGKSSKCNKAYVNYAGLDETCPTKINIAMSVYLGREKCHVVTPYQQCVTFSSCQTPRGGCAASRVAPFSSSCLYDGFRESDVWVYCQHCGFKLVKLVLPQCCSCRKWSLCTGERAQDN
ncbi:uncharacterized protein LOC111132539 [Crassostrea virginica]